MNDDQRAIDNHNRLYYNHDINTLLKRYWHLSFFSS